MVPVKKRIPALLLVLVMLLSFVACSAPNDDRDKDDEREEASNTDDDKGEATLPKLPWGKDDEESGEEAGDEPDEPAPEEFMIAPALDPASVEPSYDLESMDSVIVPDFGAATGYRMYSESEPDELTIYKKVKDVSLDEMRSLVDEYFNYLASLPYFEVADGPREVWSGNAYTGVLNYIGNGRVIPGDDSMYNGTDYAFDFYITLGDAEVFFQYAEGLKIVDTGLRLGDTDYPTQQVYGDHICDAFYECGGTYYSSDRALAANKGECAVILNGETYIGTTEESDTVRFFAEGYHRADWVEIYLEPNYPMDEDIYNRSDLIQYKVGSIATNTPGDIAVLSVSDNNGADWTQPVPRQNASFAASSVRVLQWEPEGDVVLYFYADLLLNDEPYEIEGLIVTNPAENEAKREAEEKEHSGSSSSSDGPKTCSACTGSGNCGVCGGSGYRTQWMAQKQERVPCGSCMSSGNCTDCGGDGKK